MSKASTKEYFSSRGLRDYVAMIISERLLLVAVMLVGASV